MEPCSRTVATNGIALHTWQWGAAQPNLVLLHGSSHCGGVWSPLAERLAADGWGVLALDLRGHGRSAKSDSGYGWAGLRDDVGGLLTALDLRDVLLVGHSRGGGVSLLTAAALPERVRGVLVYEPTVVRRPADSVEQRATIESRAAALSERALNRRSSFPSREAALENYRGRGGFRHWREEYLSAYVQHGFIEQPDGGVALACPPWVEALLYMEMTDVETWAGVLCPDMPVLALFGEHGGRVRPGRDPAAELRAMFPRCEAQTMAGATHFGPMERPQEFEQTLRAYAARLGVTPAPAEA